MTQTTTAEPTLTPLQVAIIRVLWEAQETLTVSAITHRIDEENSFALVATAAGDLAQMGLLVRKRINARVGNSRPPVFHLSEAMDTAMRKQVGDAHCQD